MKVFVLVDNGWDYEDDRKLPSVVGVYSTSEQARRAQRLLNIDDFEILEAEVDENMPDAPAGKYRYVCNVCRSGLCPVEARETHAPWPNQKDDAVYVDCNGDVEFYVWAEDAGAAAEIAAAKRWEWLDQGTWPKPKTPWPQKQNKS